MARLQLKRSYAYLDRMNKMYSLKDNITGILIKNGHLTRAQLEGALNIQKEKILPLRKVLVDEKLITESALSALFSGRLYIPALSLENFKFDSKVINLLPEHMARSYNAIPLLKTGNTLIISTSDPLNVFALNDLNNFAGCNIVLSAEDEIARAIESHYHKKSRVPLNMPDGHALTGQVPIAQLVDIVLAHALDRGASDIHIEPEFDCLRIRYRVDGLMQDVLRIPKIKQNSILAKLKIISNLNIAENHIPQDGKFKVRSGSREAEFRVSSLPTTFGQRFVLHVLGNGNLDIGLDHPDFPASSAAILKAVKARPFGMVLVSGPAGSGKTTTLYSVLNKLNTPARNIITIEDPVECQIDGITQVQVRPDTGLDFACGLYSVLRQNPDVLMISQINDSKIADAAVKTTLSGKLVFSTLQADDTVSSINRLIEMGVEPFLLASSLAMLCTQRLARKICFKCRKPADISKDLLEKIGFSGKANFYTAEGCRYCSHTGFSGRVAILETLLIDDAIRDIIISRKPVIEISRYAVKHLGLRSLRDDSYLKAKEGLISLDEAMRITTEE